MSFDTFKRAIDLFENYSYHWKTKIGFGGGEPTIHPQFWNMIEYAMPRGLVSVITNGKRTEDAIALARLAKRGWLIAELSQDEWHQPISDKVMNAFRELSQPYENDAMDLRDLRITFYPFIAGRIKYGLKMCCCQDTFIREDGKIYFCGCPDAPQIGDVWNGIDKKYKKFIFKGKCHKHI